MAYSGSRNGKEYCVGSRLKYATALACWSLKMYHYLHIRRRWRTVSSMWNKMPDIRLFREWRDV